MMVKAPARVFVDRGYAIVHRLVVEEKTARVPPLRCPTVQGMEDGHHGRPGASAAQAVRLGLKFASGPVTILHPGMEAECVWGKAENKDSAMRRCHALSLSSGHHGLPGPSAVQIVVEVCTLAPGTVRMEIAVQGVRWSTKHVIWSPVQRCAETPRGPLGCQ